MATIQELTSRLNEALKLKAQIEALEEKLDALLSGSSAPKKKVGKRTMSPATIEKMRAAQQARWAKIHGKSSTKASVKVTLKKVTPTKTLAKKKVMSPEANAKIAAAMKARWEAKKKGAAAA